MAHKTGERRCLSEFEVTSAMIEAGQSAFWAWEDAGDPSTSQLVRSIFSAALAEDDRYREGALFRLPIQRVRARRNAANRA